MLRNRTVLISALLSIIGLLLLTTANFTIAANPLIFASPSSLEKEKGQAFDLSVAIDNAGQRVCAVEGRINLNNLSCQNIVLSNGLSAQTSPTCANPAFLLGIQGCDVRVKNLLTLTVKTVDFGNASVTFSNVDIIGEGVSISSASTGGSYKVTEPVTTAPSATQQKNETPKIAKAPKKEPAVPQQEQQQEQKEETTPAPVVTDAPITLTTPEETAAQTSPLTAMINILPFEIDETSLTVILAAMALIILALVILYLAARSRRRKI